MLTFIRSQHLLLGTTVDVLLKFYACTLFIKTHFSDNDSFKNFFNGVLAGSLGIFNKKKKMIRHCFFMK